MNNKCGERRESYGYLRRNGTTYNAEMADFVKSGKRLITYWAENIRPFSERYMAYDTFRRRVSTYLKSTKEQKLSPFQKERVQKPEDFFRHHAFQYLQLIQSGEKINIAQYFEVYIIVPSYDVVPSYEQFSEKLNKFLKQQRPMDHNDSNDIAMDFVAEMEQHVSEVAETLLDPNPSISMLIDTMESMIIDTTESATDMEGSSVTTDLEYASDTESCATEIVVSTAQKRNIDSGVTKVYACVQKATGALGGNGSGGPIYGELTVGSMQAVIDYLVQYCNFSSSSRFIDVGSGRGKPNFHVAQDPGVRLSIEIEVEHIRYWVSII